MKGDKPKGLVEKLINQAGPMIEERIGGLRKEADEEFKQINTKLDRIIELLEAR